MSDRKLSLLAMIGPGLLVAATGVGAGDLATGAFAGTKLGVAVLWAVIVGAGLKFVLNEGLARWQLATGDTLLEGCVAHFGRPVQWGFLAYLVIWSYFVGSALMSAIGVTSHALLPLFGPGTDKIFYGLIHSGIAVVLVKRGGYRLFSKVMGVSIAVMFTVVITTAIALRPSWQDVFAGLLVPTIPDIEGALDWTIALMGGVGGTLTVLCYGYWIREEGRQGIADLRACRIDLVFGYAMTAFFGIAMVIIGSRINVAGGGATLIVDLADHLEAELGSVGTAAKWAFLVGAWGAVFSSLLGVWQSVPYLYADFWSLTRCQKDPSTQRTVSAQSIHYQGYLFALATVPAIGLWTKFEQAQKLYAIIGAMFIPMLAIVLLVLNGQSKFVGARYRNSKLTSLLLIGALLFFVLAGWYAIQKRFSG